MSQEEEHAPEAVSEPAPVRKRGEIPPALTALVVLALVGGDGGWFWFQSTRAGDQEQRVWAVVQKSEGKIENLSPGEKTWLDKASDGRAAMLVSQYMPPPVPVKSR